MAKIVKERKKLSIQIISLNKLQRIKNGKVKIRSSRRNRYY